MKHVQTTISEELRVKLVLKMFQTNKHKTVKQVLREALELYLKDVSLTDPLVTPTPPRGGHAENRMTPPFFVKVKNMFEEEEDWEEEE